MSTERLLKVISWLDRKRWESPTNYNIINNEIFNSLNNAEKILVHWLSYITDRQMPFEKIWITGGYVFSGIVYDFSKKGIEYKDLDIIEQDNGKLSFSYKGKDFPHKNFASRFISTDLKSVLLTLRILSTYKKNILLYVNSVYLKYRHIISGLRDDGVNSASLIAFILHLLSYEYVKPNKGPNMLRPNDYFHEVEDYFVSFHALIENEQDFSKRFQNFVRSRFKGKKRTWCCTRDYFKSIEFKKYFIGGLGEINCSEELLGIFCDKNTLYYLELPGDVWNLKEEFVDNLLVPNIGDLGKNISKGLRKFLMKPYYPELFDLSFDFVPRMCLNATNSINKVMCRVCIFGKTGMEKYCQQNPSLFCPVVMICCGYEVKCDPNGCPIKDGSGIGLCKKDI